MKFLVIVLCFVAGSASAKDFTKSAISGQVTRMAVYKSWDTDCKSKLGIVKVVSKPSHGTLKSSEVTSTIVPSRHNPEKTAHCVGRSTNGFQVDYVSAPGFQGTDRFTIQFNYGHGDDTDNYIVNVR